MIHRHRKAYIAFGANIAFSGKTPKTTLVDAAKTLQGRGVHILAFSRLWHSPAWPDPRAPSYINAVAHIATSLPPMALLHKLRDVERQFGRKRALKNAPRTLDLDLIAYQNVRLNTGMLKLPHPRAAKRAFVLLPLLDIAISQNLPGTNMNLNALIGALPAKDVDETIPLTPKKYCNGPLISGY